MRASTEQYLKIIFTSSKEDGFVKVKDISERMGLTSPTVTEKLKSLSRDGFLEYVNYKGARLTAKGESVAVRIISVHRVWELFLHEVLGIPLSDVHEDACELEHATSDSLMCAMYEFLGRPEKGPSGKPIYREVFLKDEFNLASAKKGQHLTVKSINDAEIEEYLNKKGLYVNSFFTVDEIDEFSGSLIVGAGGKREYIGRDSLDMIYVSEVKNEK